MCSILLTVVVNVGDGRYATFQFLSRHAIQRPECYRPPGCLLPGRYPWFDSQCLSGRDRRQADL